jgi:excisionase family DNA binding protein
MPGNEKAIIEKLNAIESLLKKQADQILTFRQAAEYIDVSRSYLYKLTSLNRIPFFKPEGKRLYFSKAELDTWIKRNPVKTATEIEQQADDYIVSGKKGGGK